MFKKFLTVCTVVFLLAGCSMRETSSSVEEKSVSETEAEQLIESLEMENLSRVKDRVVLGMIFGGDQSVLSDSCMYRSDEDGNYDMVGIFYSENMEECKNYIDEYLLTLKEECNTYYPEEVFKISNAIIKYTDEKLVLIICDDIEEARKLVIDLLDE